MSLVYFIETKGFIVEIEVKYFRNGRMLMTISDYNCPVEITIMKSEITINLVSSCVYVNFKVKAGNLRGRMSLS